MDRSGLALDAGDTAIVKIGNGESASRETATAGQGTPWNDRTYPVHVGRKQVEINPWDIIRKKSHGKKNMEAGRIRTHVLSVRSRLLYH